MLTFKLIDDRWYITHTETGLYFKFSYVKKSEARYRWSKLKIELDDDILKEHFVVTITDVLFSQS